MTAGDIAQKITFADQLPISAYPSWKLTVGYSKPSGAVDILLWSCRIYCSKNRLSVSQTTGTSSPASLPPCNVTQLQSPVARTGNKAHSEVCLVIQWLESGIQIVSVRCHPPLQRRAIGQCQNQPRVPAGERHPINGLFPVCAMVLLMREIPSRRFRSSAALRSSRPFGGSSHTRGPSRRRFPLRLYAAGTACGPLSSRK